jgi:DNA-binding SARP family transcriptional activator
VLAHLALSGRPAGRERLASLLFADADDPLGALRWNLAELRRVLGLSEVLRGDPPRLELPAGWVVDVGLLEGYRPDPDMVRGELLEGTDPSGDAVFGAWLLVERRRLAALCEGILRDGALAALGGGRPHDAAELAGRALEFGPFDESLHELLVRCLRATGDVAAARGHADACEALFRRELGHAPDPRVRRAAHAADTEPHPATGDRAAARGQLAAGTAALEAGAVEPGLACLRLACGEARALGDPGLLAPALAALGSALVHAVRGRDEEGAALLPEALAIARDNDDRPTSLEACRELGYIDVQAGRGAAAGRWLHRATALAVSDDELAPVLGIRGMSLSDRAHYDSAARLLTESIAAAERGGGPRQAAWSRAILGRAHLLRGHLAEAAEVLDRSLAGVHAEGWVALRPLPESLLAEVSLRRGDAQAAAALVDGAFALSCRLGDPCWEACTASPPSTTWPTDGCGPCRPAIARSPSPGSATGSARWTIAARTRADRSARGPSRAACCGVRGTATTTIRSQVPRPRRSPTRRAASPWRCAATGCTWASRPNPGTCAPSPT